MENHLLTHELILISKGIELIAGVDEVGRGCLAGPMVVGAVILNPTHLTNTNNDVSSAPLGLYNQIKDSKLIQPKKRLELANFIKQNAISYSIQILENTKIDQWGISKCTQVGFFNAITTLTHKPQHIITDAFKIKVLPDEVQTNIIHGDNISISVAAASIIAKVFRDTLMENLHASNQIYQKYSFDKHKGYGTKQHIEAINKYGICDLHRKSFEPIKSLVFESKKY